MKLFILTSTATAGVMALSLTACASNDTKAALDAVTAIATDPNCSHDDAVDVVVGAFGMPGSLSAHAHRQCPQRTVPPTVGQDIH